MLPVGALRRCKSQKYLVNERRRLQRVACRLAPHAGASLPPQLVIENGKDLSLRVFVTLAPTPQQRRDVVTERLAHARYVAILRSMNTRWRSGLACGSRRAFCAYFNARCVLVKPVFEDRSEFVTAERVRCSCHR